MKSQNTLNHQRNLSKNKKAGDVAFPGFKIYYKITIFKTTVQLKSPVQLSATPWTVACQASLSVGFPRQEYWKGSPFPSLSKQYSTSIKKTYRSMKQNRHHRNKLMHIQSIDLPQRFHLNLSHPLLLPPSIFPMKHFFASDGQSTGVSASASVLPINIQDWLPLGWTGSISLLSKGLSRVFSNTIVQKHQFFNAQYSLGSNSLIHTWLLEKP